MTNNEHQNKLEELKNRLQWASPRWEDLSFGGYILCSCGRTLQNNEATREHWQMGHFDRKKEVEQVIQEAYTLGKEAKEESDCSGCIDPDPFDLPEGRTHQSHTKQHPCPEGGDPNCGYCFPTKEESQPPEGQSEDCLCHCHTEEKVKKEGYLCRCVKNCEHCRPQESQPKEPKRIKLPRKSTPEIREYEEAVKRGREKRESKSESWWEEFDNMVKDFRCGIRAEVEVLNHSEFFKEIDRRAKQEYDHMIKLWIGKKKQEWEKQVLKEKGNELYRTAEKYLLHRKHYLEKEARKEERERILEEIERMKKNLPHEYPELWTYTSVEQYNQALSDLKKKLNH